jgi:alpha-glucuronidase
MTFTHDPNTIEVLTRIMVESREAVVDYMTPLGLHTSCGGNHHYGPAPGWEFISARRLEPVYYHRADDKGMGLTEPHPGAIPWPVSSGSTCVVRKHQHCPEEFLLWFHHVPWDHRMKSGKTLWDELALHYQRGVEWVRLTRKKWEAVASQIDPETLC